jgi:hypothetical protein
LEPSAFAIFAQISFLILNIKAAFYLANSPAFWAFNFVVNKNILARILTI